MTDEQARNRFWSKVSRGERWECWIYTAGIAGHKYGRFGDTSQPNGYTYAHRFAYNISHPKPAPDDMLVLHICNNPRCVNPLHLYVGTYSDNNQDTIRDGGSPHRKLSDEEVREIRMLYSVGDTTHRKLATEFNVHKSSITSILSGDHYSWLD